MMTFSFNDLLSPNSQLQGEIDAAALRVLHSGWYVLGAEVNAFEAEFAAYHGVEHAGAIPVLVDVDEEAYTMDPAAARAAITPRSQAILPVHLYGQPADMVTL